MCFGGSNTSDTLKQQQLQRQQAVQQGMLGIDQAFQGYNPAFYKGVQQSTLSNLLPQLNQQYGSTRRNLASSLSGKGLLNSSAAKMAGTDLEKSHSLGQIMVSNQAIQAAQDTQKQVESQKQNVTNQLVVSQDPNLAAQQAVSAAASISAPSITAPIGNLFQGVANTYLANQVGSLYPNPYPGGFQGSSTSYGRNESATGKNYYIK